MPKTYSNFCCSCGKEYTGRGKYFCSAKCLFDFRSGKGTLPLSTFDRVLDEFQDSASELITVKAKEVIVCADFHFPYVDKEMFKYLLKIAEIYMKKPRTLVIVGDLVDFSSISKFDNINKESHLDKDLNSARLGLNLLLQTFSRIYYCMGNHDIRYMKKLEWFLSATEYGLSLLNSDKLIISERPLIEIESGGVNFFALHPSSYSRVGKVPVDFCIKYRKPVLSFHGHLFHIRSEPSGCDFGYDVGCMTDQTKHLYTQRKETTHPTWTSGFCMIRNGSIFPFTSNPKITNWDFWLKEIPSKLKGGRL